MRECGGRAILQITQAIPIFVFTQRGLDFVANYSNEEGAGILRNLSAEKHYLLSAKPSDVPLVFGEHKLFLSETPLPVASAQEPEPLR